ncbi:MAG: sensor histidine kinase [Muricoprocola sp.]
MKQKINIRLVAIAILAIAATMFGITFVYYGLFQEQIRNDLKVEARLLSVTGIENLMENESILGDKTIRITWISQEGEVLFDNDVAADHLNNHMNRPEVLDAIENGYGESVRKSDTMNLKTFYYALLLEDGTVIRVATEARSLISVFMSTFPIVFLIIVIIMGLCIVISHFLTKQLLKPISEMAENIDYIQEKSAYKELLPFIDRIREQHDDILASARARQEFTANVSHELKTPITAISGYAELIENQMVDADMQIKFAGDIRKNASRLVTLVNDIIRLSELDQSSYTPDFQKIDLYEIAQERVELLQNNAREKQISLVLQGSTCFIMANRGMIVELLDNLIQNAIRYNIYKGKIKVTVQKKGNQGILIVSDTGIGIPREDQTRVFERFYRVDKSRSRETGGTGLGLAIVKHIVELHEGTINLQSELGKGTTITVQF